MELMKSWVDTCIANNNIWLVLVFHGVDGIGWEPKSAAELEEYFSYMKEKEDYLWVATFADVTKYIRERKSAVVSSVVRDDVIVVNISSELDPEVYDVPITLKTYVPRAWETTVISKNSKQEDQQPMLKVQKDVLGTYVFYSVMPGEGEIILAEHSGI